jgi:hypothetical protein
MVMTVQYLVETTSGWGNRSTQRKPAPVPLCPPWILDYLTRTRTRAAAVGSRQLTAWTKTPANKSVTYIFTHLFPFSVAIFRRKYASLQPQACSRTISGMFVPHLVTLERIRVMSIFGFRTRAVMWPLYRKSRELTATGMVRTLHYISVFVVSCIVFCSVL